MDTNPKIQKKKGLTRSEILDRVKPSERSPTNNLELLYLPLSQETWGLFSRFDQEKTPEQIIKEALMIVSSDQNHIKTNHEQNKFPSSGDLLLIAHDEWKRRQERKGFDDEIPWVSGWISGYLTSKKFVDDQLIILHTHKGDGPP